VTQDRMLNPKHASTHTFPDKLTSCARTAARGFDAAQMGPQCGGEGPEFPCRLFLNLSSKLTTLSLQGKAAAATERRWRIGVARHAGLYAGL
jgi:hypothetical protein